MTVTETITDQVLGPLLGSDPARPRITHYDDATGSRIELSGATLANWAAKTANWLRDELDIQPGDEVAVLLPPHWQTAGILLGAWWCGASVSTLPLSTPPISTPGPPSRGVPAVAFCPVDGLTEVSAEEVVAVGLDALGMGLRGLPPGVHDYATEIRVHGDTFTSGGSLPAAGPGGDPARDTNKIVAVARTRATELKIHAGDRVLCTTGWDGDVPGEVLLAVLVADASLVQCTGTDPGALADRRATERITVTLTG